MTNDCKTCPVSTGTHKPAEAVHQIAEPAASVEKQIEEVMRKVEFMRGAAQFGSPCELDAARKGVEEKLRTLLSTPQPCSRSHPHEEMTPMCELRTEIARLTNALARAEAAAPQAVQAAVPQIKANCYSNDDGDYWRDCPDDCDFVEGLKVGDTYELQASVRSWSETFRVTKAPDETSDDYEVELVSSDAPAHPAEGVPAQCPNINEPRGCWRVACQLGGKCREPERSATQPAAQEVDVVQAAKALCKHAAKVQNVNFDDYWLIHAEEFKEEAQIVLDAAQAKQGGE